MVLNTEIRVAVLTTIWAPSPSHTRTHFREQMLIYASLSNAVVFKRLLTHRLQSHGAGIRNKISDECGRESKSWEPINK